MTEYIKKSDIINLIKEYEQMGKKIYKNNPNIKSLDIAKLKKEMLEQVKSVILATRLILAQNVE